MVIWSYFDHTHPFNDLDYLGAGFWYPPPFYTHSESAPGCVLTWPPNGCRLRLGFPSLAGSQQGMRNGTAPRTTIRLIVSFGRTPKPLKKPWNTGSPVNANNGFHGFKVVRNGFRNHPQYHWLTPSSYPWYLPQPHPASAWRAPPRRCRRSRPTRGSPWRRGLRCVSNRRGLRLSRETNEG